MTELAHATLGASSAERWMACPGSVPLSAGMPDNESDHAREGSAAHALAEHCLLQGEDAFEYLGEPVPHADYADVTVSIDMSEAVQVYIDHMRSYSHIGKGRKIGRKVLEARVSLEALGDWAKGMFGTADGIHHNAKIRTLHVDDYKHGQGVLVEASTPQTKFYGVGGLLKLALLAKAEKVVCTIVQPRAHHPDGPIRSVTYTVDELMAWVEQELKPAVRRVAEAELAFGKEDDWADRFLVPTEKGCKFCRAKGRCPKLAEQSLQQAGLEFGKEDDWADRFLVPTEKGCKFCRAKGRCPKLAEQSPQQADLEFGDNGVISPKVSLNLLTEEQVAAILDNEKAIKDWLAGVAALAQEQLLRGQDITGGRYKLVAGRSSRDWKDEDAAVKALRGLGFGDEHLFTQKFTTPAQAEKLVGKAHKKDLAELIVTTEGKPTLAPADDKRAAIQAGPESDFG